jgi:hypothetical protein
MAVTSAGSGSGLVAVLGGAQPVGVGAGGDDVGVEGEPVDDGSAEAGVGEGAGPFHWNWLKFPIVVLSFDVLVLVSGVSA